MSPSVSPADLARGPDACVTDPANRVALAVVRSLGRAGVRVRLGVPDLRGLPGGRPEPLAAGAVLASRYIAERFSLPSPLAAGTFADALATATRPGDVILPVSINSLLAALSSEDLRRTRRLPFASAEAVRRVNSKPWILAAAAAAGLRVPRTLCPASLEEALDLAAAAPYPCVLKLRDDEGLFLPPAARYAIARDPVMYRVRYRALHAVKPCPIVQEFVEGEGWGVGLLYWRGRRVAHFVHRRLHEYPRAGGPASLAESVRDPALLAAASGLLEAAAWEGPAQVEFRRERRTGRTFLMEVNPRFWGTLPLAVACGVDFPLLVYRLACGETPRSVERYPTGVRLRFAPLSAARLAQTLRAAGVAAALLEAWDLAADGRAADGFFQRDDPAPARAAWRAAGLAACRRAWRILSGGPPARLAAGGA